jgi:NAD-dependent dihydropyrimidine dehydrogenase PreA subunit
MCYLCDEYGDSNHGNGIWYLNPYNYARNMYKLRMPGEKMTGPGVYLEGGKKGGRSMPELLEALEKGDQQEYNEIRQEMHNNIFTGGGAQVLPLKDADKVLELCSPIGLIACICRKRYRARDERNELEYTCMGMGVGMLKWERWPERYKGGVRFVSVDEAKEWNHEMDKRGFCHLLMMFGAPFIGGFCQCDYPDCESLRNGVDFGIGLLKSHYVAQVDYDICNGCGICAQRCQWGALKFEVTSGKANIDQFKCYGCGICETGCPRGAIKLIERKSLPALAEVWL